MRHHLSQDIQWLFRKRGVCEEHQCPRPCFDCMWSAAYCLQTALRQTRLSFKVLVKEMTREKSARDKVAQLVAARKKKKSPHVLSDQELEIYRRELHERQSMVGYNQMMAIARTLLAHIDATKAR
jgi:hypothetical protein